MKQYFKRIILLFALVSWFNTLQAQTKEGFSIKGKIAGLKDTTVLFSGQYSFARRAVFGGFA